MALFQPKEAWLIRRVKLLTLASVIEAGIKLVWVYAPEGHEPKAVSLLEGYPVEDTYVSSIYAKSELFCSLWDMWSTGPLVFNSDASLIDASAIRSWVKAKDQPL